MLTPTLLLAALIAGDAGAAGESNARDPQAELPLLPPVAELPEGRVLVQVLEGSGFAKDSWECTGTLREADRFVEPAFGIAAVPRKYTEKGLASDRTNPFLLRALAQVHFPAGKHRFLLRSFGAARLFVGGRKVLETRFKSRNASGHESVPDLPQAAHPQIRLLGPGHAEEIADVALEDGTYLVILEAFAGGKGLRLEIGELAAAVSRDGGAFVLLGPGPAVELTDAGWEDYAREARMRIERRDAEVRRRKAASEGGYWDMRHELARRHAARPAPDAGTGLDETIDTWIERRLAEAGAEPAPPAGELAFLRRLSLDTRGIVPTEEEVEAFLADRAPDRRTRWVDRMAGDPRWADHWVSYWQDVLAENPGILKPELNNTGPFRWWIHESVADNKPMDRFVTELVMMEGSVYGGGPAGFSLATQNDVPMAAKAHVLGTAFLGLELKCARCHDAPYHPYRQEDLFRLAAMLARKPLEVPATSSVPRSPEELARMLVEVTLEPGSTVEPAWPFEDLAPEELPPDLLRDPDDTRERLAAIITSPRNDRFPQMLANRVWKRLMGWGLVEPVHDWEGQEPSHPELLELLGRELQRSGYDLKHLAKEILRSRVYAREAQPDVSGGDPSRVPPPRKRLFRGPVRRRMGAEEVVDSLFAVTGKDFACEELNLDVDGRRPVTSFLNLGTPRRAWEFTSLSNERDRPALAMPIAQSIADVLKAFGWREARQDAITCREETPTVLQPLVIAHGTASHRLVALSDGARFTELALEDQPLDVLVRRVFLRVLTRPPHPGEEELFVALLEEGYGERLTGRKSAGARPRRSRHAVSWSNHLSPEATRIKLDLERALREGDPPAAALTADWRERMEDMLWALINSPEFIFVP